MKPLLILFTVASVVSSLQSTAQEFPKGWVMYLQATQGMTTNFTSVPDAFTGSVQLVPQVTVVPNMLRLSATAALAYNNKKLFGLYGPGLHVKLADLHISIFGSPQSFANLQLQLQHLWGSEKQKMAGGGLHAELGQLLMLGGTVYRDYNLNNWWFQTGVGFNLLFKKKRTTPDDPFNP